jgi:hypothetical protein
MDTFVAASDGRIPGVEGFTVLYALGFIGASSRIRSAGMARFFWSSSSPPDPHWIDQFMKGWRGETAMPIPIFYFGDLDPAGLRIFAQMRTTFPEIGPWKSGYQLLINRLIEGEGHSLDESGKEQQGRIIRTGCPWMDQEVIPVMEDTDLCVDQEAAINL